MTDFKKKAGEIKDISKAPLPWLLGIAQNTWAVNPYMILAGYD